MGMFDTILLLPDAVAHCPEGHPLVELQTKDLDAAMDQYLVTGGRLLRVVRADDDTPGWRLEDSVAVHEQRYGTEPVAGAHTIRAYTSCHRCPPLLVRTEAARSWGDLLQEHELWVDVELHLVPGAPLRIVRTSGTREDQRRDLAERGLHVLPDDHALAVAHRELKAAEDRVDSELERPRSRRP
jgi:hypothetical protein